MADRDRAAAFGRALREERERARMTQHQLASEAGLGDKTLISKWEKGRLARPPSPTAIRRLATILDVSPARMLRAAGYDHDRQELDSEIDEIRRLIERAVHLLERYGHNA